MILHILWRISELLLGGFIAAMLATIAYNLKLVAEGLKNVESSTSASLEHNAMLLDGIQKAVKQSGGYFAG